ncbi:Amino-acid carrier protein AlsT [Austwickia sp. TVS 96-490-7B]|uniref:alanine/glycine:cation symporter family protein n=1 Tax=Austwickia sp. TVS 96-490-7B TaxID=2830843 RepID=UPI001C55D9AF|nr:alanine/glycine:cation symporter family protein [Austwickia sp. TVS 96-490-7B]MBW3084001.1 Amino-acid carrier protein AlsT [Austwickia sp. TVS 96-490-7B]
MQSVVDVLNDKLTWLLVVCLPAAGIYFTIVTRGVQFRHLGNMWRIIFSSRGNGGAQGISSFQAFAISLASRVGTGNIVGVAIALTLGGPGAIFWMWVMAFLGMATAYVEATLAQLYKIPHEDGSFRGGPAYYIQRGLKSRTFGVVFAAALVFTFGFSFNGVQANTITGVVSSTWGLDRVYVAIGLTVLTALVIFGGIRQVAKVTEWMAPLMALIYVLLAVAVLALRITDVPAQIVLIFKAAFGMEPAIAGALGGIIAALLNGVKRGMFSNEAGMGSAPNAAATATTSHPVHQGLIQSAGVFVDTIVVCTATAVMILLAGPEIYTAGVTQKSAADTLTQTAVASELGTWVNPVMAVLIFVFAFSSILGNYAYAEINQDFIGGGKAGNLAIRILVVVATLWGGMQKLGLVWDLADVAMSVMAVINLTALVLLGRYAAGALRDFEAQPGSLMSRVFDLSGNKHVPDDIPGDVWHSDHAQGVANSPHGSDGEAARV